MALNGEIKMYPKDIFVPKQKNKRRNIRVPVTTVGLDVTSAKTLMDLERWK